MCVSVCVRVCARPRGCVGVCVRIRDCKAAARTFLPIKMWVAEVASSCTCQLVHTAVLLIVRQLLLAFTFRGKGVQIFTFLGLVKIEISR